MDTSFVLTLTDEEFIPISVVVNGCRELGNGADACDPRVITQTSSLSKLPVESSSVDAVVCIPRSEDFPGNLLLAEITRVLKPGGKVLVYVAQPRTKGTMMIERKLLLSGFVDTQTYNHNIGITDVGVRAKKPSWDIGSSFQLKKTPANETVKLQLEDDAELIDEDSLLTEDDLKKPQLPANDCGVGSTKKACRNCTCGKAEAEEKVKLGLTTDQIDNPKSACGNCGLGDPFRCGTCPYKGLPPFKLGEKISISGSFLAADM